MPGPSEDERLKALEARIAAAKRAQEPRPHMEEHYSQAQLAWRMVVELVAGLGIGFGIGYGLDMFLGTQPWLMMMFTILGFVAGVKTMIRSAEEVQRKQGEAAAAAARNDNGNEKG
jgi:ATP synthase protein I